MFRVGLAALALLAAPAFASDCILRQSDAIELPLGPFVDATDGVTAETGLTISQADVRLKKCTAAGDCAAWAQVNESTSASHDENGWYEKDFDATDTNTVGILQIAVHESGALPVFMRCTVVEEAVYDADFAASATGLRQANVASVTSGAIDNADFATAPGASGGLLISGSNSGTTTLGALTVTGATTLTGNVSMAAGLNITQSSSNAAALVVTGNGTGNGATFTSGSGATGNGIAATAASTNGNGFAVTGTGTGSGLLGTAGATGDGLEGIGGATSGAGIRAAGTAGNSPAMTLVGQGSAAGLLSTGGATGPGISAVGGSTSGSGLSAVASTSGSGIVATGVGTTQPGIAATGGSTSSAGISATGGGTGAGILATAGSTGNGFQLTAGSTSGNPLGTTVTQPIGAVPGFGIQEGGTLQSATSTTAVLRAATAIPDDNPIGMTLEIVGGTGVGQSRSITDWVSSTDTATVATWTTTPDNTSDYLVWGTSSASGAGGSLTASDVWSHATRTLTALDEDTTTLDLNATTVGTLATLDEDTTTLDLNATTIGTVTTLTNLPSITTNWLTAAGINADAFTAAKFAADVTTELQSGLATASALSTVSTNIGTPSNLGGGATLSANLADVEAQTDDIGAAGAGLTAADDAVMTVLGTPAGASVSADIATLDDFVDTEVAAILDDTGSAGVVVAAGSKSGYALSATGLNAITLAEPAAKPTWSSSSLPEFWAWLIVGSVNKITQTSTTKTIRNDADNANIATCAVSDSGGTFTLSECTP